MRRNGFTLLEVMVAIGIVAAVIAFGATRLVSTKDRYRSFVQKIAISSRELRNISRLKNQTTRLSIKLDEKESAISAQSARGYVPVLSEEQRKDLEKLNDDQKKAFLAKFKFSAEDSVAKKPFEFPKGLFVESVEYPGRERPVTTGTTYIHFFPQGLAEEALIVFTDRKTLYWTVAISPLTGRTTIFDKKVAYKDLGN